MIGRALIKVAGKVQGVFFRDSARQLADKFNITGYAKNLSDGSVEIVAEGKKEDIKKLIKWCHEGPANAVVGSVDVVWKNTDPEYETFRKF